MSNFLFRIWHKPGRHMVNHWETCRCTYQCLMLVFQPAAQLHQQLRLKVCSLSRVSQSLKHVVLMLITQAPNLLETLEGWCRKSVQFRWSRDQTKIQMVVYNILNKLHNPSHLRVFNFWYLDFLFLKFHPENVPQYLVLTFQGIPYEEEQFHFKSFNGSFPDVCQIRLKPTTL